MVVAEEAYFVALLQERVSLITANVSKSEQDSSKKVIAVVDEFVKINGQMQVEVQNLVQMPEHLLPMLQVTDDGHDEIVTNIFNFVDSCGGLATFSVDTLERFLASRGIIEPRVELVGKEADTYYMCNMSSHLNKANLDEKLVDSLEQEVARMDEDQENIAIPGYEGNIRDEKQWYFESKNLPYKNLMLEAFRLAYDPFSVEIKGETGGGIGNSESFDYEPNPSDPANPQKKCDVSEYGNVWDN